MLTWEPFLVHGEWPSPTDLTAASAKPVEPNTPPSEYHVSHGHGSWSVMLLDHVLGPEGGALGSLPEPWTSTRRTRLNAWPRSTRQRSSWRQNASR
jgi:hypothetical protein